MIDFVRQRFEFVAAALFVAAWVFVFGLRTLPIGGEWGPLDPQTDLFVMSWVSVVALSIIAGGWVARSRFKQISEVEADPNLAVIVLSLASLIGAILIIVEFAFVRGYGFTTPVTYLRHLEVNRGVAGAPGSLLSGPGRLMLPAILPALLIIALCWQRMSTLALLVFIAAAVVFLFEQVKFEGGRWFLFSTYIALALVMLGDLLRSASKDGRIILRKVMSTAIFLCIYAAILLAYSGWVFASRYADKGESQEVAYERIAREMIEERSVVPDAVDGKEAQVVIAEEPSVASQSPNSAPNRTPYDDESADLEEAAAAAESPFGSEPGLGDSQTFLERMSKHPGVSFFWLYATHGVNELNNLVLGDKFSHSLGAFQFPQLARISDRLLGTDLRVEYKVDFPNDGLYTTMIGASFVDFGFAGAVGFGALFGIFLGFWANLFGQQQGATFSSMAFPLMMTIAISSPIVSVVSHTWPAMCWAAVAYFISSLNRHDRKRIAV